MVGARITALDVYDVRFPTSRELDGSDATNVDPDYSAAYAVLRTDGPEDGYGFVFTTGIGNDVQCAAIAALRPWVVGRPVADVCDRLGPFARELVHNPHLRWLGPEKGIMHMAIGAMVNAAWDLAAKRAGLPVWLLLARLDAEQVVELIDFSWLTDALTPDDVRSILARTASDREERVESLQRQGFPAYTTTPGWLGYTDEKLDRLSREAVAEGFTLIKLKVGADVDDDLRRLEIARAAVGPDVRIAVDANQHWGVDEAIAWMGRLAPAAPYWIEEPTHPDDILGHARIRRAVAPIKVATGEHVANRVMVKQLLQAEAIDILQIDATRVGGVNDNLAHLFLAAQFGVPVCPHAGGVGLCEVVQHLAMYDAVAVAGRTDDRVLEYVDHLHEHFVAPVELRDAHYVTPSVPGLGSEMHAASMAEFAFPDGPVWSAPR